MKGDPLALLVESDEATRDRLGTWLEAAGYRVIDCPGPRREDFTCLGIRGRRCALLEMADIAILDGRVLKQAGDDVAAATRLLHYYVGSEKPIVVLMDRGNSAFTVEGDRVATANPAYRESVVAAIQEVSESTVRQEPAERPRSSGIPRD